MQEQNLNPYEYAPHRDVSMDDSSESEDPDFGRPPSPHAGRLGNVDWCRCKHCGLMPTLAECICCKDIAEIRTEQLCVTLDADFEALCLNTAVLRVAYIDVHVNREDAEIADDHT
ncbi:hypothetical protein HPB52_001115 [Rhipicephalus sanguineus]|uniref:P2X purinoreceptor 7 intracellular domain-containing protein n=2 Tax=Rhipicephalus sanguineus TaxID=34632 RepID=A0A9D4QGU3_RHISA|nr:hypothetical protein HPB52_001115 [Rhipicephalus sanguineus]